MRREPEKHIFPTRTLITGRSRLCVTCGLVCAVAFLAQFSSLGQNLIINGDFEHNTAGTNQYNLSNSSFNSLVPYATAFGTGQEIDLMTADDTYGPPPQSGLWKLGIHRSITTSRNDAFSFTLSTPLAAGQQYALSFYAQDVTAFDPGNGAVQVGLSSNPTTFGTVVFSGTPSTVAWTHLSGTFTAPVSALYLTVQVDPNAAATWANIDNFSLTLVPEPRSVILLSGLGLTALLFKNRLRRSISY